MQKNNTSGFVGVCWHQQAKRWVAYIYRNRIRIHLGYFDNKIKAAMARDKVAILYRGEKAVLNFPEKLEEYKKELGAK